jgi:5S rRNA maturation endonuclease (ribonuclease M5)
VSRERSRSAKRDLERAQRLLRRVQVEEILEELGLEILYFKGPDAYTECPDPSHDDADPSFHVCCEDVEDRDGSRLGAFNCWSHPGDGLGGGNLLNLIARVLFDIWGEDGDGEERFPRDDDRSRAAAWVRTTFLDREEGDPKARWEAAMGRRKRARVVDKGEVHLPPGRPIADADPRFQIYLEGRDIPLARATELGVIAIERAVGDYRRMLDHTVPGVLFPIHWDGALVNWFIRSTRRHVDKGAKGRYAPVPLGKLGVIWLPDKPDVTKPLVLVEGIFDAERTRRIVRDRIPSAPPGNVGAVLSGHLLPEQARRLRSYPLVIHLADADKGGETLSESIKEQLDGFVQVAVRKLPKGTDPGDAPEDVVVEALLRPGEDARPRVARRVRRTMRR